MVQIDFKKPIVYRSLKIIFRNWKFEFHEMSLDLSMFRDAAEYLRMSEEKRMEIMASQIAMAKQIGGPKPVWVPTPEDPDTGYTPGKSN